MSTTIAEAPDASGTTGMARYWKLVQFVLLAIGGSLIAAWADGQITGNEWVTLGILALGAVGVWFKRNTVEQPSAKAAVAIVTAAAAALATYWSDLRFDNAELVMLVLAVAAAVNVDKVANAPGPVATPVVPATPGNATDPTGTDGDGLTAGPQVQGVTWLGDTPSSDGGTRFLPPDQRQP